MSRLWPDELAVHLAPHRVCLLRVRRGLRREVVREAAVRIDSPGPAGWEGALGALEAKLAEPDWTGVRVRVVISDLWVRYAVVPFVAEIGNAEERASHARELLASLYGDAVSDWSLCLSDAPPGASRLVCAAPAALLQGLRDAGARVGARLVALQPQLIAAYNNWRHAIPAEEAWFVTIDEGTMAAARLKASGFDRVHTVRIGGDWIRELKRLQTFGRLANSSAAEGRVYVDAPPAWRALGAEMGRELEWLERPASRPTTALRLDDLRRSAA